MSQVPPSIANLRGAVDLSSLVNRPAPGGAAAGAGSAGAAPGGAAVEVPSLVLDGGDANFSAILDLSSTVPVIVVLWSPRSPASEQLTAAVGTVVGAYEGRLLLARVDVDQNPQLAAAFQAQAVPTTAAIVGGRPVPLFTGTVDEAEMREVFDQVLQLAAQNGVAGTAAVAGGADPAEAQAEPPLPPLHAEAYDAIERGDYAAAAQAYRTAIAQDPRDSMAVAGLAQVSLLGRLQGKTVADIRDAAAQNPSDIGAQLDVADLDVSGGHVDDAFDRLLSLFPSADAEGRNLIRTRLVEYFEVVGVADPRVVAARRRLTTLLY